MQDAPTQTCPICTVDVGEIVECDAHSLVLRQGSGLLLAPRRHAERWRDLSADEQAALTARIGPAQGLIEQGGDRTTVLLDELSGHVHFRLGPTSAAPRHLPGQPHNEPLISGGEDALHAHLLPWIDAADRVDLAVSFLMASGIKLVLPHLRDLLERGGRLRILTGDYLDITDPEALRMVQDLEGDLQLHIFRAVEIPFHPKAWIFGFADGNGALIVGSSNLSRSALTTGVEWNLRHFGAEDAPALLSARAGFEALLARPEVIPLTREWIDEYETCRAVKPERPGGPPVPASEVPKPHAVQEEALAALQATRASGYGAGLVVLATGLGKTFLAAFDSQDARRVLFVAHREEILTQAMSAFRAVRPRAHLGRFTGEQKEADAEILFASVQTLSRSTHLDGFAPNAFDYIVVDEFHHASAATYRKILSHFTPAFLLGLTATPDRTDGGDLLGLCQENLVYECDLWSGIERELLAPFHYFGVPDPVEYAQIPWRSGRFDEAALTEAVATQARARNALEQLEKRGGSKTIGFCVSRKHADFMAEFARDSGLRAVAVHSGPGSAPRTAALKALDEGALDIVFAVDMFNEGVDVPSIDTVLMLRPTESPVIWLQQLGRGLRKSMGKTHLAVIDYIGNHRIFLTKARVLFRTGAGDGALRLALERFTAGEIAFPEGCEVTYELQAIDLLKGLIRQPRDGEELAAYYRDFRDRHGVRPTASEMQHAGFNPGRTGHAGWLGFVDDMGDLGGAERHAWQQEKPLLDEIETTSMTRSYKMLVLRAALDLGALPGRVSLADMTEKVAQIIGRNPQLRADFSADPSDRKALQALLKKYPLKLWSETAWFTLGPGVFETTFEGGPALSDLVSELVDWRILRHLGRPGVTYDQTEPLDSLKAAELSVEFQTGPTFWKEYTREQIAPLFGATFNTGSWQAGIVVVKPARAMVLLVTMGKANMLVGGQYKDHFEDASRFVWQTQTSTRRETTRGKIISGVEQGWKVHLFLRGAKLRDGRAAPFRYAGPVSFAGWEGESPITVQWDLAEPVPQHLQGLYGIDGIRE